MILNLEETFKAGGHAPPEIELWAAVVGQALSDWMHHQLSLRMQRVELAILGPQTVAWFRSGSRGTGSFRFCCDILDLDRNAVAERMHRIEQAIDTMDHETLRAWYRRCRGSNGLSV